MAAKTVLLQRQFVSSLVEVIPHGMSLKHLREQPSEPELLLKMGIVPGDVLYFCPVRADEHKDPSVVLRAAALLKEADPKVKFLLTVSQEDALYQQLYDSARSAGLHLDVDVILRPLPYHSMATFYRRAAACIVPSLHESFGQTVLEAFSFRCPVIAANIAALSEIVIHEENGLHFTENQTGDLVQCLYRLNPNLNPYYGELRRRLISKGEEHMQTLYTAELMAGRYDACYENILEGIREKIKGQPRPAPA